MPETREAWLNDLVEQVRPWYAGELPKTIHVSVGFSSKGMRSKTIGECWNPSASEDGAPQVFIHPKISDPIDAAAVLVHELVHAAKPDAKHGAEFKRMATALGLEGRMTSTSPSDGLRAQLQEIVARIGPYPHPALDGTHSGKAKQSTRLIKAECQSCGYVIRTTQKWIEQGLPICPCGTEFAIAD